MLTLGPGATTLSPNATTSPASTDAVDAVLAASGDPRAFERLYRRHVARVHSLVRRMMGAEDVDDVTQGVFIRAWEKLGTFRGDAAFGTWLHRLAVNLILARRASRGTDWKRHTADATVLSQVAGRAASSDFSLDFEEAIGHLPPGAREIFVLHDIEGYKHEEIAGMLGIVAGTSKAQLHRARMALRQHLDR